jgi:hypothetical protein
MRCHTSSCCSVSRKARIRSLEIDPQTRRRRTLRKPSNGSCCANRLNQPLMVDVRGSSLGRRRNPGVLNLLADSLANARVLLLVNYRPEYRHEWGNKTYYYAQLRLDPLGKRERARDCSPRCSATRRSSRRSGG